MKLFNTLTRQLEEFQPLNRDLVRLYCCGPTVYNFQHVGNLRTYIFEDVLVRTLRYAGYRVRHVMNITDVGHLVSDADEGEDKMIVAMRREGKTSAEIAAYYTEAFLDHCRWLHIAPPDVICRATEHIPQMIALIERLVDRGYAYVSEGNVYFEVSKFSRYGELAQLNLEDLRAGARIEVDSSKRHPLDFALWFTKSKFENQELQWDSPWGRGYPGWHIECSAMSMNYLGEQFDIHCGGIDHIPVHHTNEIAQSEGATGRPFVRYLLHSNFLVTPARDGGAEKMAKSKGEFLTLDLVKERGFDPLSYRLFCLGAIYRNELLFGWQALEAAENTLTKLRAIVSELRQASAPACALSARGNELLAAFNEHLFNDLATPRALAVFHETANDATLSAGEKLHLLELFDEVLALGVSTWRAVALDVPAVVTALADERLLARRARNWPEADRLRREIAAHGFAIEDTKDGYTVKKF